MVSRDCRLVMQSAGVWIYALFVVLVASWMHLLSGAVAASARPTAAQYALPDAPGRSTVERVCTTCHGAAEVFSSPRTPPVWREMLELMKAYGAEATADDWNTIAAYIMANVAFLGVNKAPAEDIGAVLAVDQKTARGIVAYRDQNGRFTSIDDLKKAPGVDAARLDALKERLLFEER